MAGIFWLPKTEIRNRDLGNQKSEITNRKSKIRLSKGTWRDVITLQPSSQAHDKKTHFEAYLSPEFFVAHTSQGVCSQCIVAGLLFGGITSKTMSVIASLGVKEEIKNILDSGGFLRNVQQHLQAKFPQIRGISRRSVRRYCQTNGLRRFSAKKLSKTEQENAVKRASKEVHFSSLFLSPYLLVTVCIRISTQPWISAHSQGPKSSLTLRVLIPVNMVG